MDRLRKYLEKYMKSIAFLYFERINIVIKGPDRSHTSKVVPVLKSLSITP
jgi:hypothetical protein